MTLAALSPLYTWWPLFFVLLAFLVKVVCPAIVRGQSEPPAELVAAISSWPPPRLPRRIPQIVNSGSPNVHATVIINAFTKTSKWPPPDLADMVHTYVWTPRPETSDDDLIAWAMSRPPHSWTRVA